jgi:hexosaminidase
LWTEYIPDEKQAEYMLFPRIAALSEVAWGTARPNGFPNFQKRLEQHFALYDKLGINYSRAIYDVKAKVIPAEHGVGVALSANGENPQIGYGTSGEPGENSMIYSVPVNVAQSEVFKAARFQNGKKIGNTATLDFHFNMATGKKIGLKNQPSPQYPGDGAFTLVNGISGDKKRFGSDWLGFEGDDLEATIDLGEKREISAATVSFMENAGSWIYYPKHVWVSVSTDNVRFKPVAEAGTAEIEKAGGTLALAFKKAKARFIKITAENTPVIPDGKPGADNPAWLFTDEISIER